MSKEDVEEIKKQTMEQQLHDLSVMIQDLGMELNVLRQQFHNHGHLPNGKRYVVIE